MTQQHECDNCGATWNDAAIIPLEFVKDLGIRLDPGSVVPSGECPGCGALVYLKNPPSEKRAAPGTIRALEVFANNAPNEWHVGTGKWGEPHIAVAVDEQTARTIAACLNAHTPLVEVFQLLCDHSRLQLSRMGVAGHRQTASGEWVADPYTEAFDKARALLSKIKRGEVQA